MLPARIHNAPVEKSPDARNPFEAYADTYTALRARKRRKQPAHLCDASNQDERIEERSKLAAHYRQEEARRTAEALASPQGKRLAGLLARFDRLAIDDADCMIDCLEAEDWLFRANRDFRHLALRLIDKRISRIRRDAGLVELDSSSSNAC
jgi:hypothetical protein